MPEAPALFQDGELSVLEEKTIYEIITYETISEEKLDAALADLSPAGSQQITGQLADVRAASRQGALANMCIFPLIMLVGYILLTLFFASRGGYQAQVITAD